MAIDVETKCSDCGTVVEQELTADDKEILCPECRRNMPNLPKDEFKQIEKTQSSQRLMGILALLMIIVAGVLMYLWAGQPAAWISTANPDYLAKNPREDTVMFLAGATGCVLLALVFGFLGSRKRYVVEF